MKKSKLPFGWYNALLCLMAACAAVLVCLCAQEAEARYYLKWDVSGDGLSRLSDYTLGRLAALEEDVTICPVYAAGADSALKDLQTETLLKMAAVCPRVQVEAIDPNAQPQRLADLAGESQGVADGTVFVRSGATGRTIRLEPEDFLFSRRLAEDIYTIYCGEAQLIGAIDRATRANPTAAWFVTGHGEAAQEECAQLALQLQAMGFAVHSGALGMIDPSPADVLLLIDPQSDLTQAEADRLVAFLDGGGKLVAACGADTPFARLPRLTEALALYGLSYRPGWVVEARDAASSYVDRPELLSPSLAEGAALASLPGRLILPRSCAIGAPALRPGVTASALLVTSPAATLKQDTAGDAYAFDAGDVSGAMTLALLASSGDMRILQLASADMLRDGQALTGATVLDASENLAFLSACLEQMIGEDMGATLDAGVKQLPAQLITFDSQQTRRQVSMMLLTALPLCLLALMAVVLLRRRRL